MYERVLLNCENKTKVPSRDLAFARQVESFSSSTAARFIGKFIWQGFTGINRYIETNKLFTFMFYVVLLFDFVWLPKDFMEPTRFI